jgi:hypothetical protein
MPEVCGEFSLTALAYNCNAVPSRYALPFNLRSKRLTFWRRRRASPSADRHLDDSNVSADSTR